MAIYALADLHLSISCPEKDMRIFGPTWEDYHDKIEKAWRAVVKPEDLVLIPGDISWAMKLEQAEPDLTWIDALPGTKLLLQGNHDYWWGSAKKMAASLPPSLHALKKQAYRWGSVGIAGARLGDSDEFTYYHQMTMSPVRPFPPPKDPEEQRRMWQRELQRLEESLRLLPEELDQRLVMTHYPPIGPDLAPTSASTLMESYGVGLCCFGHLHGIQDLSIVKLGTARGITYRFVAADYLHFRPLRLSDAAADQLEECHPH